MEIEDLQSSFKKIQNKPSNPHLHSELHALVDEVRISFGETAKKGPGSFGFYLGFFKRLGIRKVRQILAEMKESKVSDSAKLFWWKVKQEFKSDENE